MKTSARFIHFALLFGFSLTLNDSAQAAIKTWTGTTDNIWATGANWGGAVPVTGDSLVFTSATGLGGLTLSDNLMTPASFNVAGITFNAGSGAYVINPATPGTNGFTLTGNVLNSSTSLQTINDLIAFSTTRTFTTTAGGGDIALGGNISGGGYIIKAGAGTLTLSGDGTLGRIDVDSGGLTVSSGTYTNNSYFTLNSVNNGTNAVYNQSGGSVTVSSFGTFVGNSTGAGTGTVNLSGGTFTSNTSITTYIGNGAVGTWNQTGGTANFAQINAAQSGTAAGSAVNVSGGTFNSSGIYYLGVAGASTLSVSGAGIVNLAQFNAGHGSAGTVNVTGGALNISGLFTMGSTTGGSSTVNLDGGTLSTVKVSNGTNGTRTFNFNGGTLKATGASTTFMEGLTTANVKNGGAIIDTNNNNITIGQSLVNFAGATTDTLTKKGAGILTLSGANTYTAATDVQGGTLQLTGSLSASTSLNLGNAANSGKFILGGTGAAKNQTVAGLTTTGNGTTNAVVGGNAAVSTLTVNKASGTDTFAGALGGVGANENNLALTKSGNGTLILSGISTYTGATNVNGGKMSIASTGTINGTSGVTIAGGEFNYNSSTALTKTVSFSGTGGILSGSGTINNSVNITVGNTLAIGNSPGTMNFGNTLALNGTTVMEIDGNAGAGVTGGHDFANLTGLGAAGVLTNGGALTLDMGTTFGTGSYTWNLFDFASETGDFATVTLADQYSGSLINGGGIWSLSSGNDTWQFTESTGVLGLTVIPEPAAALLGGLGLLALLRRRRN